MMRKQPIIHLWQLLIASLAAALFACTTPSSSAASTETLEADVQLTPTAPGVSEGEHGNQHVIYVSSKAGAEWLIDKTRREYNDTLARYTQSQDTELLPRLSLLNATLAAAGASSGSSFSITSVDPVGFGEGVCMGGGNACSCRPDCLCMEDDQRGCACICKPPILDLSGIDRPVPMVAPAH